METPFEEQREYKRYAQLDDAVAVCHTKIGRVINISESGMEVIWLGDTSFPDDATVTILSNSKDMLINDLPVRFLSASNEPSSNRAIKRQRTRVSFNFANPKQHSQIKEYIAELASNGHQGPVRQLKTIYAVMCSNKRKNEDYQDSYETE